MLGAAPCYRSASAIALKASQVQKQINPARPFCLPAAALHHNKKPVWTTKRAFSFPLSTLTWPLQRAAQPVEKHALPQNGVRLTSIAGLAADAQPLVLIYRETAGEFSGVLLQNQAHHGGTLGAGGFFQPQQQYAVVRAHLLED